MSTTEAFRNRIRGLPNGKPFTTSRFANCGPRSAVDRALSRFLHDGGIKRLSRGVFVHPRKSRFAGNILPGVFSDVPAMAKDNGGTVKVHGADSAVARP